MNYTFNKATKVAQKMSKTGTILNDVVDIVTINVLSDDQSVSVLFSVVLDPPEDSSFIGVSSLTEEDIVSFAVGKITPEIEADLMNAIQIKSSQIDTSSSYLVFS